MIVDSAQIWKNSLLVGTPRTRFDRFKKTMQIKGRINQDVIQMSLDAVRYQTENEWEPNMEVEQDKITPCRFHILYHLFIFHCDGHC